MLKTLKNQKGLALRDSKGFTLIEILVVIGIIAVLAAVVLIAINPARQFAQAHNTQRTSNIETLLNAIGQNIAENKGTLGGGCPALTAGTVYTVAKNSGTFVAPATATIDLSCLTPTYISTALPIDPSTGTWTDATTYNTQYNVTVDAAGRYTISAPKAELSATISLTR